jgi:hypothetical protein
MQEESFKNCRNSSAFLSWEVIIVPWAFLAIKLSTTFKIILSCARQNALTLRYCVPIYIIYFIFFLILSSRLQLGDRNGNIPSDMSLVLYAFIWPLYNDFGRTYNSVHHSQSPSKSAGVVSVLLHVVEVTGSMVGLVTYTQTMQSY